MKNIYIKLFLLFLVFNTKIYAGCPVNLAPTNITASTVCENGYSIFSASLNDLTNTLVWLDSANRIIGSGNNFQYKISEAGLNFKVAEVGYDMLSTKVGPLPSQFTSTYPSQNFTNGQYFSCLSPLRIDSILLRSNNPLSGFIQIWNTAPENGGYVIQKYPFNINKTGPANTRVGLGAILNTGNYFINVEYTLGAGVLYRAIDGATYPYQVNNLISITGSNFLTDPDRYYYFFDWDVSKMCIGPISSSFSPTFIQTLAETLPYYESFDLGLPCDWGNEAPTNPSLWLAGNSSVFSSTDFVIPNDAGVIASNDIQCACDKSSVKLISPWFDFSTYSKSNSIKLTFGYLYKEAQNSKVYIHIRNKSNTILKTDSLTQQLVVYGNFEIDLNDFILEDSIQIIIEHKDFGGDSSAVAIKDLFINSTCTSTYSASLNLTLDSYASEISWEIRDAITNIVVAKSLPYLDIIPYQINNALDQREICLEKGKHYIFKISDSFGDGLNDGTNTGRYLLKDNCGDTILFGQGALPYGGQVLPETAWDSIIFKTENYKVNLGSDQSVDARDTLILDAGEKGPYIWSTGDTTRYIEIYAKNYLAGEYDFSVTSRANTNCSSSDTISITILESYNPDIIVKLTTDTKGSEIKWELRDAITDTIIFSKGPFQDVIPYNINLATHIDTIKVEYDQSLVFKITDLTGNGLYDGINQGSIQISNLCQPVLFENNNQSFPYISSSTKFDSIVFVSSAKPIFNLGNDTSLCVGDSIILDAGGSANEYLWSNNKTGKTIKILSSDLVTGDNFINVKTSEGNCYVSDTIKINVRPLPSADFTTSQTLGNLSANASVAGASSYEWDFGDGATASGLSVTHTYTENGTYDVSLKVKSFDGCENSLTKSVVISGIVGISKQQFSEFILYPNPSSGTIIIEPSLQTNYLLEVLDLQGRKLYSENIYQTETKKLIDVSFLSNGIYLLVLNNKGNISYKKLILEK